MLSHQHEFPLTRMKTPVHSIVILGGGSAGLITALTLKRRLPHLELHVLRSQEIGVIGVGEGTTSLFPSYFFEELRLKRSQLFTEMQPTWKLGIRFLWGPRKHFHYTFSRAVDSRVPELPKGNGFYAFEEFSSLDMWSALMEEDKAFPRGSDGKPQFFNHSQVAFHVENHRLVTYLEARCRDFGVRITDGTMQSVEPGEHGVSALVLESGERVSGDLFIDASGFRSELLGRFLGTPFRDFTDALFCDRAVIGGWARTTEVLKPYTTAETMNAGWCWQIEHENFINRGYVYSSRFLGDDEALAEFLGKNPQVTTTPRVVKFRSGRYEKMWTRNVIGIGNASGFVEPLEATALQVIIMQGKVLADVLSETDCAPTPGVVAVYDQVMAQQWDDVRDFLAVHYRFNRRLDTPFWQMCQAETRLHGAQRVVDFYEENGPTSLARAVLFGSMNPFGMEGYLAMLIGQQVPHRKNYEPSAAEWKIWRGHVREMQTVARRGFGAAQTLQLIRQPGWSWS